MTPDLLRHQLILKYFGTVENIYFPGKLYSPGKDPDMDWMIDSVVALRVLRAMSETIEAGERYLALSFGEWTECSTTGRLAVGDFHPYAIRLPDQFQLKPEAAKCCLHGDTCPQPPHDKHSKGACDNWSVFSGCQGHDKPAPEAPEFGEDIEAEIHKLVSECPYLCVGDGESTKDKLRALCRKARAGKGER